MQRLRPLDAAFEGFRIVRDRPGLILAWTGFYLAALFIMIAVLLAAFWLQLSGARGGAETLGMDQTDYLLHRFGFLLLIITPIACAMVSVVPAAITRSVVRPADGNRSYIRLGWDEMRLLGLQIIVTLFLAALNAVYEWLVRGVLDVSGPVRWLVPGLAVLISVCFSFWLFFRLSLVVAATVHGRRISILEAWRATTGQIQPLAMMWLMVLLSVIAVTILSVVVSYLVGAVTGGFRMFGELSQSDITGISRGDAVRALAEILVQFATGALWLVLCLTLAYAAAARAWLQLTGEIGLGGGARPSADPAVPGAEGLDLLG